MLFRMKIIKTNLNRASDSNKTERYLNNLIILNGFFSFILKLPDTISNSVWIYHNYFKNFRLCFSKLSIDDNFCVNMIEISEFFSSFSYSFDVILLYKFNSQFRNSFKQLLKVKNRKHT
jgi:hypothetical protein